jgi:hypothetical protein
MTTNARSDLSPSNQRSTIKQFPSSRPAQRIRSGDFLEGALIKAGMLGAKR